MASNGLTILFRNGFGFDLELINAPILFKDESYGMFSGFKILLPLCVLLIGTTVDDNERED
jgi:hypothetical protein